MTVRAMAGALTLVAAMLAAGCSGLKSNAAPSQIYLLQPALAGPARAIAAADTAAGDNAAASAIAVLMPTVAPGLANQRIALTRSDGRLDYYDGSRWPGELPEVLQTLAIDALRAGGRFASVQSDTTPSTPSYALQIEVRHFEAQYPGPELDGAAVPAARVTLVCTLIRRIDRAAVASFTAESAAPATTNRMGAVIAAFNQALGRALQQLVENTRT